MMTITETNRARTIWILVAATVAYGLINVLMFYTTDSFGPVWFATSLAVYGVLLVASVAMAVVDTGRATGQAPVEKERAPTGLEPQPANTAGLELLGEEVLYETASGKLARARFQVDGAERSLVFAVTPEEVLPVDAIEERLDATDHRAPPPAGVDEIDAALERRAIPEDGRGGGQDGPSDGQETTIEVTS